MGRGIIGGVAADGVLLYDVQGTATGFTVPFPALAYSRLEYYFSVESNAFGGIIATLTGLNANSYNNGLNGGFAAAAVGWLLMGDVGPFDFQGTIWLPAAPRRKSHFSGFNSNGGAGNCRGNSSDVTHEATALAVVFGASFAYRAIVRGY